MNLIRIFFYLTLFILQMFLTTVALPSYYYVAKDGMDYVNDGSFEKPWKSFTYAIANSLPGDTIIIRQGLYHNDLWLKSDFGGAEESLKTVKSYPGEKVITSSYENYGDIERLQF